VAQTLESLHILEPAADDTLITEIHRPETPVSVPSANDQLKAPRNYYNLLRNKGKSRKGLFYVHRANDKYYLEIPDTLLGRDLLVVTRIAQGAAGVRPGFTGYAGDQVGSRVIRFEKGPDHKIFLRRITFEERAGETTEMLYKAVVKSNLQPLVAAFGIGAYNPNGKSSVIDVSDYVNGDNDILFFHSATRKAMNAGTLLKHMSYISDIQAFPTNVEIRTVKTFEQIRGDETFTIELNSSIVLLPEKPMRKRYTDNRIGYFSERYLDFNAPDGVREVSYIKRWRLEPKPEDVQRYLEGELVEPVKPIVFYIDPATPKQWVTYLKQGVEAWQAAFEQAGFKNAILAREAPHNGVAIGWSLEDAQHSAIVYKASTHANAAGPVVTDPRTGEILESHINWYHNLVSLLRDWYFIQCSPVDPRARKPVFDDELMGQLLRSVASHEVGHALGLTHNFGASSTVPVKFLRDKNWLAQHGITPSVMDYARFNYVAQIEDSVDVQTLVAGIGPYDRWAIEWGYRWFPDSVELNQETSMLNSWVMEKMNDDALWYGSEFSAIDPRTQTEDIGSDAIAAGQYGVTNLKIVMNNLLAWSRADERHDYKHLAQLHRGIVEQYQNYIDHTRHLVGGVYENPGARGAVFRQVPASVQRDAVGFISDKVFETPQWLLDTTVLVRTGESPLQIIGGLQHNTLNDLLSITTLSRLIHAGILNPKENYGVESLLSQLDKSIWTELNRNQAVDIYRRGLQRIYVDKLIELTQKSGRDFRDVAPIVSAHLHNLSIRLNAAATKTRDEITKQHLKFMVHKIEEGILPAR